jgi:hypothetical protein
LPRLFWVTLAVARIPLLALFSDEGVDGEDRCLRGENFFGEDAVNFGIGVEAGILQDETAVIHVGGATKRGERDATGGNSEEHQVFNSARAQNQVELVLRERAHTLFIDDEVFGTSDGAMEFSGWRANNEKIVVLQPLPARLRIRKFGMARGKSQPHVDDQKLFLARKIHSLGGVGNDGVGRGDKPKNSFLDIERKQSCVFRLQFHVSSFLITSRAQAIAARPSRRSLHYQQLGLCRCRFGYASLFTSIRAGAIIPALRDGGTSMRNKMLGVSLFAAVLAVILSSVIAIPAFASGDDKPATPASIATVPPTTSAVPTATRPDREKKVYTNDDIDQMWPKEQAATNVAQAPVASAYTASQTRRSVSVPRARRVTIVVVSPQQDPVWYATQIEALNAELDSISGREASLRDFRATGTGPGLTIGLQFDAPCDGITTDNAIQQLELRRREIELQIDELQDMARQNGVSPAVFQNPTEILQAAQKPLSPGQERAELRERQSDLIGQYDGVQNQLADMSNAAAAQGITLLPVTPNWGGNLTTNRIQSLDERAQQIQDALSENEDAARRAGIAPSALP